MVVFEAWSCMKEEGLLNTGGLGSLAMAVDETPGRCGGIANMLGFTGGSECVTAIDEGLIVLPDKGGAHSKDVDSTVEDSSENPPSISSVSSAFKSVMAAAFLASMSLKSAPVFRDSSLMMAFSSFFSWLHTSGETDVVIFSVLTSFLLQFSIVSLVLRTQELVEPFRPLICGLAPSSCKCCLSGMMIGDYVSLQIHVALDRSVSVDLPSPTH